MAPSAGGPGTREQVAARVRERGHRAWAIPLDLGLREHVRDAARAVLDHPGTLDLIVLCAGKNTVTPLAQVTAPDRAELIEVNLTGPFLTPQALAPAVRAGGSITTVASVAAHTGAQPPAPRGREGRTGRPDPVAGQGTGPDVRVNCVPPGITDTPMGRDTSTRCRPTTRDAACRCRGTPRAAASRRRSRSWPARSTSS